MSRRNRHSSLKIENVRTTLFDTNENSKEASESSSTMTNSDKSESLSQRTDNDVDENALNFSSVIPEYFITFLNWIGKRRHCYWKNSHSSQSSFKKQDKVRKSKSTRSVHVKYAYHKFQFKSKLQQQLKIGHFIFGSHSNYWLTESSSKSIESIIQRVQQEVLRVFNWNWWQKCTLLHFMQNNG